jgi:hypothetical protein
MRWTGHVIHMGEDRKVYQLLVGKPKGKRALGRLRLRVEWIQVAQDMDWWLAIANTVMIFLCSGTTELVIVKIFIKEMLGPL